VNFTAFLCNSSVLNLLRGSGDFFSAFMGLVTPGFTDCVSLISVSILVYIKGWNCKNANIDLLSLLVFSLLYLAKILN
jgi:uncharacterized protein YqgC (DUF456 family)